LDVRDARSEEQDAPARRGAADDRVELGPLTLVMQAREIGSCMLRRAGTGRVHLTADNIVIVDPGMHEAAE